MALLEEVMLLWEVLKATLFPVSTLCFLFLDPDTCFQLLFWCYTYLPTGCHALHKDGHGHNLQQLWAPNETFSFIISLVMMFCHDNKKHLINIVLQFTFYYTFSISRNYNLLVLISYYNHDLKSSVQ